ncbi:hypothetical protein V8G54_010453 [Vigna mungo]|uniref:Uncharacterized protein n=1 Tax=Vigna mungo TaxID=3915 RepID=A0AAQ3NVT5_VIGMU
MFTVIFFLFSACSTHQKVQRINMQILKLFVIALMPNLKVLLLTVLGSLLAMNRFNILSESAINNINTCGLLHTTSYAYIQLRTFPMKKLLKIQHLHQKVMQKPYQKFPHKQWPLKLMKDHTLTILSINMKLKPM